MKKAIVTLFVIIAGVFMLSNCGGGGSDVELSPEMQQFVGMFDGSSAGVSAALAKYAVDELKEDDMGMYDLKDPIVTAREGDCYTLEVAAGITTRIYSVCWAEGKISKIEDKGMK